MYLMSNKSTIKVNGIKNPFNYDPIRTFSWSSQHLDEKIYSLSKSSGNYKVGSELSDCLVHKDKKRKSTPPYCQNLKDVITQYILQIIDKICFSFFPSFRSYVTVSDKGKGFGNKFIYTNIINHTLLYISRCAYVN